MIRCIFILLFLTQLHGLERRPWFYPPYHFHAGASLEGWWFSSVDHGYNPIDYHSNNILVQGYLLFPFAPAWEAELEMELERTTKRNFGFESIVLEMRKQILDDVQGDVVSLDVGVNARYVPHSRLADVAVPYHHLVNFEVVGAVGKETTYNYQWIARGFLFAALGQADKGYPWLRTIIELEARVFCQSIFRVFGCGYYGFGPRVRVNVGNFDGYAYIKHRSFDIGASYSYLFDVWGKLTLQYFYRPYARSFPEKVNAVKLTYDLPFSF